MKNQRQEKIENYFEAMMRMQKTIGTRKDKFFKSHGLNRPQTEILYFVAHEGKVLVKDIATQMSITSSAVTQIMEGLVKLGYLERIADEKDRRLVYAQFSPEGKVKFGIFKKAHIERIEKVLSVLSDDELEAFTSMVYKVLEHTKHLDT